MSSIRWKRSSSFAMAGPNIAWSNVDYNLTDFIKKSAPPQVVKVKKDGSKSSAFKNSVELVLHESKTLKKIEACVVSEGKTFVLPYDCPAKVYQLTKAEEYCSLGDLRKALPTCRFFLITSKPKDAQFKDIQPGEVLTIVFKKTISGSDVFTCERKKLGVKVEIKANAQGGFAPMGTTQERKISDFVRHYSTFPVGIVLTESTLTNKAFGALNDLISQSKSGLIRLTRLFSVDAVIASTLGKKKTIYSIPKELDFTVTASKALLLEDAQHIDFCRKLHEEVDKTSIERYLSLVISFGASGNDVLTWSYGDESLYEEVSVSGKAGNGDVTKRDGGSKEQVRKISSFDKDDAKAKESRDKIKEKEPKDKESKEKSKDKEKDKEKSKDKQKEKKTKEPKAEKTKEAKSEKTKEAKPEKAKEKVEKTKSKEKERPKIERVEQEEPVEDDAGYLVPAELLKAQRENSQEEKNGEGKERSSIGISLGRFMDKVKGKKDGKKSERPASSIDMIPEQPQNKSATMPAASNKKTAVLKDKSKTMSADELNSMEANTDDLDGPSTSPKEKEAKKRDKKAFGTAGKKAGAKLRQKLGMSKSTEGEQGDSPKPTSPTSASSLPPSPNEDDGDQDMYVTPVDNQLGTSCPTSSLQDRQLPELPPEEPRKPTTTSIPDIPYDDDDLYDEINPVPAKTFKIPKDLSKLSTNDVSDVLRSLNMGEHVSKFRNEQIDGEIFKSLDDKTLGALGVTDPVQRLKIKKLLKGWRPKN